MRGSFNGARTGKKIIILDVPSSVSTIKNPFMQHLKFDGTNLEVSHKIKIKFAIFMVGKVKIVTIDQVIDRWKYEILSTRKGIFEARQATS